MPLTNHEVAIQPVSFWSEQANFLRIEGVFVILGAKARVHWELVDKLESGRKVFAADVIEMTQEEYDLWTADDSYVMTWLLQKLGLTAIS